MLGHLAENYLHLAMQLYGLEMLLRPIVIVLMLLSVLSVFFPLIERRFRRQIAPGSEQRIEVFSGDP